MPTPIPAVTDAQFAFGFRSAADPPPVASSAPVTRAWRAVAAHIIAFGLGEKPELVARPGVDLDRALRMLGALLATPDSADSQETIGRLLAAWFVRVRPQGGPLASSG